MLLECINTSVWNLFIIPEEDWSQSKSIEEYEVNKLKNEDGYSCFYAFVQLPGHSSKTVLTEWLHAMEVPGVCTKLVEIKPCPFLNQIVIGTSVFPIPGTVFHVIEITLLESFSC